MVFFHFLLKPTGPEFGINGVAGIQCLKRAVTGNLLNPFLEIVSNLINTDKFCYGPVDFIKGLVIGVPTFKGPLDRKLIQAVNAPIPFLE